jgi:hypothetical protein
MQQIRGYSGPLQTADCIVQLADMKPGRQPFDLAMLSPNT